MMKEGGAGGWAVVRRAAGMVKLAWGEEVLLTAGRPFRIFEGLFELFDGGD